MAKIISFMSQKGGVGKSTLLVHLAVALRMRGLEVAIIDMDYEQRTVAGTWHGLRNDADIPVIACAAKDLAKAINYMKDPDIDVILIDTAGRHDPGTPKAVRASDLVIVPVTPDSVFEIQPMGKTVKTIKDEGKAGSALVVLTRTDPTRNGFESADTVAGRKGIAGYGLPVADQAITFYKAFKNTVARGGTVLERDPSSKAADQIKSLAGELVEKAGL